MPCGLHSAIFGILAGRILGFGTVDRLLFFPHRLVPGVLVALFFSSGVAESALGSVLTIA